MSKSQRLPLAIGAFIFGAIILVFIALLFFSGGRLFAEKAPVIMYFNNSVQGLQVGAPVKLKGVIIGEISDISINFPNDSSLGVTAAVHADLLLKRINLKGTQVGEEFFSHAIGNGLRAQLNYLSLLTGQLYVELDFYPSSTPIFHGKKDSLLELPTIANDFESLSKDLQSLNLKSLVTNVDNLAMQLSEIAASGKIQQALDDFDSAANAVKKTAVNIDSTQAKFGIKTEVVLAKLDSLLTQLSLDEPKLVESLNQSLMALRDTLTSIEQLATRTGYSLDQNSPLLIELTNTLEEISRTARSLRSLSETLDEQPEAIIRGKKTIPSGE
ncbi:MlaD family protein [Shewanella polaris]|uniref:MCE family protein n=1 Tax=Shewanella polaris TaxID=2588449 RepID=A0A4Y5YFC4_9GAMM|nr:MlaD family protein [Shewanella polaris]QDE31318.1 MCE family protein [Shewanella polaris]